MASQPCPVEAYSAFGALLRGLFPAGDITGFVAVFRVYLDSSAADEIVTVGGYISTINQWERLEPDWNRILEEQGVTEIDGYRHLHMKDLVAGQRGFRDWTESRRKSLLSRLAPLLNVRVRFALSRSVSRVAFDDAITILSARFPGTKFQSILSFTVFQSLHVVASWCIRHGINGNQMAYFFESGDPNVGDITETMNGVASDPRKTSVYRFNGWAFGTKRAVPLQAADWLAYEAHLYGKRHILPDYGQAKVSKRAARQSFKELMKATERDVKWLCQRDGVLQVARHNYEIMARGED